MAWYAVTSIVIKLVVIAFVTAMPITAWLTPDIAREQAQKIMALTNQLRQTKEISVLVESQALNLAAYDKAQDMLIGQYFAHVSPENKGLKYWLSKNSYSYATAGENLAMGFLIN